MIDSTQLSVEQIAWILEALARSDQETETALKAHAWRIRNGQAPMPAEAKTLQIAIGEMMETHAHLPYRQVIAQRLHANDASIPLFSRAESADLMRSLLGHFFHVFEAGLPEGTPSFPEELKDKTIGLVMKLFESGSVEKVLGLKCDEGGPEVYESYWRDIRTVCIIADDRAMSLDEILALPGCELDDAVARRRFTREEYLARGLANVEHALRLQQTMLRVEATAQQGNLKDILALFGSGIPSCEGVPATGQMKSYRDAYITAVHIWAGRIYGTP